ncbi:anti-sigma factor domain-containing protein [Paenibacillus aceti]|uniref:Anti-sigma K factor RskA C-terminal domain-containing protein n=1 Tax=Paenibacillus aceti TaxID=1820010 RepID=A0ABQ1VPI6_9BACL|nr:hypothetical protein [Paenibacillus aceti]GGF86169.1 hypothetical protein GCM10010913_04500 [Paenibacillus aceti]
MNKRIHHRDIRTNLQHQCQQGYSEEAWIDFLLGEKGEAVRAEMSSHLQLCAACQHVYKQWEELLLVQDASHAYPAYPAPPTPPVHSVHHVRPAEYPAVEAPSVSAEEPTLVDPILRPSKSIQRRLRSRVRWIGIWQTMKQFISVRRRLVMSLGAALVLLLAVGGIWHTTRAGTGWDHYVRAYEPQAIQVMSNPESQFYPVSLGQLEPESAAMWYNASSGEMLMLVGGLIPREDQVVRVWAIREGSRDDLGVLQYHAYRAHLYVRGWELDQADILLSIEPKDGPFDFSQVETISFGAPGR